MSNRNLVALALFALFVLPALPACSVQDSGDLGESASTSSRNPPLPAVGVEVRDYAPDKPVYVDDPEDIYRGLPRADFAPDITKTTDTPDTFTLSDWDTPVKSQGSRPWCTSFAQVGVMENMIRHGFGEIVDLSEIDHFSHYNRYDCYASIKASQSTKIVPETSWPYYGSKIPNYRDTAVAKITSWRSLTKRSQVFDALRAGHPVHIGLDLNNSWNSPGKNGRISLGGGTIGGHAMAVVGYVADDKFEGGGYLLIKNSWGSKWGDLGYARMPYDYCMYGNCIFLETLGIEYAGKTWDGSTVPPPPPPSGPDPTADDLVVTLEKDPAKANDFTLFLTERRTGSLAQVQKVTYDVHETFGSYRTWTVEDPKDGFGIPFKYTTTFKGRWKTNGAAVQLKSGKTLNLAGAVMTWYYVE